MTMSLPVFFVFLYCIILICISISGLLHYQTYKAALNGESVKQPLLGMLYTTLRKQRMLRMVLEICLKFAIYFYAYLLYPTSQLLLIVALLSICRLYVLWMPLQKLKKTKIDLFVLLFELAFLTIFTASLLVYEA